MKKVLVIFSVCGLLLGCGQDEASTSIRNGGKMVGTTQTNLETQTADEQTFTRSGETGDVSLEDSGITLSCECWKEADPNYGLGQGQSVSFSGDGGRVEGSGNTQDEALKEVMKACQAVFPGSKEDRPLPSLLSERRRVCV